MSNDELPKFVLVPQDQLSNEALEALLDEFILREGTDYGSIEFTLDAKRQRAMRQLKSGLVKIVYSLETESCTVLKSSELSDLEFEA
jgi:uncharacterized protein YheU (UPF0270 family)